MSSPASAQPATSGQSRPIDWNVVAAMLAAGLPTEVIARHVGCSRTTLWQRMRDDETCRRKLVEEHAACRLASVGRLEGLRGKVMDQIQRLVEAGNVRVILWLADRLGMVEPDLPAAIFAAAEAVGPAEAATPVAAPAAPAPAETVPVVSPTPGVPRAPAASDVASCFTSTAPAPAPALSPDLEAELAAQLARPANRILDPAVTAGTPADRRPRDGFVPLPSTSAVALRGGSGSPVTPGRAGRPAEAGRRPALTRR